MYEYQHIFFDVAPFLSPPVVLIANEEPEVIAESLKVMKEHFGFLQSAVARAIAGDDFNLCLFEGTRAMFGHVEPN